jgi:hypothetical protein
MLRSHGFALTLFCFVGAAGTLEAADPRSARGEVLRVAPTEAALVLVVQNARETLHTLSESPFWAWFPSTTLGKQLLGSADLTQLRAFATMILSELGTTPSGLIEDVLGEAAVFAYTPAPADRPREERSVILIRPGKPEVLAKLMERMNELQMRSGEVKAIVRKDHDGVTYQERQKSATRAEFYCFSGDIFAFSGVEGEIQAFIDRGKAREPATQKSPPLVDRMVKLGLADSAAVLLINPRAFDADVKSKMAAAKPDEKRFLTRFAEVWSALDTAAVYLALDRHLELGVSLQFQTAKLPADAKKWLTGTRNPTTAERLIPNDALMGLAGHFELVELLELIASVMPLEPGKPDVKAWVTTTLGPVFGRDKLPLVMQSLGPNWATWMEAPAKDALLPTLVAAIELTGEGENRARVEKALLAALDFGFQTARVAYNSLHDDQMDLVKEKDPQTGVTITALRNEKFPPGFCPSFAVVQGYLVFASSPDAIRRFHVPAPGQSIPASYSTILKLSGTKTADYLLNYRPHLAKFLSSLGAGPEQPLLEQLTALTTVLELVDSAEVRVRGDDSGIRIALAVNLIKPLKK